STPDRHDRAARRGPVAACYRRGRRRDRAPGPRWLFPRRGQPYSKRERQVNSSFAESRRGEEGLSYERLALSLRRFSSEAIELITSSNAGAGPMIMPAIAS